MLDKKRLQGEIQEARQSRDTLVAQRDALSAKISKFDAYIAASEALIEALPATDPFSAVISTFGAFRVESQPVYKKPPTLRELVYSLMVKNTGKDLTEEEIWRLAEAEGAEARPLAKGIEATHFALYDLRKKDARVQRVGDRTWRYDEAQVAA